MSCLTSAQPAAVGRRRRLGHKELTEEVTGEAYHVGDEGNKDNIQYNSIRGVGPKGKRATEQLSAGHPIKGQRAKPNQLIPNYNNNPSDIVAKIKDVFEQGVKCV